jgi:hypothetical protein
VQTVTLRGGFPLLYPPEDFSDAGAVYVNDLRWGATHSADFIKALNDTYGLNSPDAAVAYITGVTVARHGWDIQQRYYLVDVTISYVMFSQTDVINYGWTV